MYTFKNTYFQQHTVCLLLISTSVSSNFFVCDTMCHSCQCNMMMHKCWTRNEDEEEWMKKMMDQHRKNTFLQYPETRMLKKESKRIYSLQHTAGGFMLVVQHIYLHCNSIFRYNFHFSVLFILIKYSTALLFEIYNVCIEIFFSSS
jgi:hypothetical protein